MDVVAADVRPSSELRHDTALEASYLKARNLDIRDLLRGGSKHQDSSPGQARAVNHSALTPLQTKTRSGDHNVLVVDARVNFYSVGGACGAHRSLNEIGRAHV